MKTKYKDYWSLPNIEICFDTDEKYKTLEPQLLKVNSLAILNKALGTKYTIEEDLCAYMTRNKTECALRLFSTEEDFKIPEYIKNAIK